MPSVAYVSFAMERSNREAWLLSGHKQLAAQTSEYRPVWACACCAAPAQAEMLVHKALEDKVKQYGKNHPFVARSLLQLSQISLSQVGRGSPPWGPTCLPALACPPSTHAPLLRLLQIFPLNCNRSCPLLRALACIPNLEVLQTYVTAVCAVSLLKGELSVVKAAMKMRA